MYGRGVTHGFGRPFQTCLNSLFRHNFLAVHETRRRADALHVPAPAVAVAEAGEGREAAAVDCAEATDLLRCEHVFHQREAQERRHLRV